MFRRILDVPSLHSSSLLQQLHLHKTNSHPTTMITEMSGEIFALLVTAGLIVVISLLSWLFSSPAAVEDPSSCILEEYSTSGCETIGQKTAESTVEKTPLPQVRLDSNRNTDLTDLDRLLITSEQTLIKLQNFESMTDASAIPKDHETMLEEEEGGEEDEEEEEEDDDFLSVSKASVSLADLRSICLQLPPDLDASTDDEEDSVGMSQIAQQKGNKSEDDGASTSSVVVLRPLHNGQRRSAPSSSRRPRHIQPPVYVSSSLSNPPVMTTRSIRNQEKENEEFAELHRFFCSRT